MNKKELYDKWKEKIDVFLRPKKNPIPEIDIKEYLKSDYFDLAMDIDLVFQLSNEKISPCKFVTDMINYGIKKHSRSIVNGRYDSEARKFPSLDFYDNLRDRYEGGDLVKNQGGFGLWPNDN